MSGQAAACEAVTRPVAVVRRIPPERWALPRSWRDGERWSQDNEIKRVAEALMAQACRIQFTISQLMSRHCSSRMSR